MTINAYLNGQETFVGYGRGETEEEAVADFRNQYQEANGQDWDEDTQGTLHVPLYESYPSL